MRRRQPHVSLLLFARSGSPPPEVAFRPVSGGFRIPHSEEACERFREKLINVAESAGVQAVQLDDFWLPLDKSLPVVFFEPDLFGRVIDDEEARAEFVVLLDERLDGTQSYTCRGAVHGERPYDVERTYMTQGHVEELFMAWLQAIWPATEEPPATTIDLPSITPIERRPTISNDEAHRIRATLEGPLAAVEAELHAGRLPEHVEHDLRLLIRQLHDWSNMVEPTTQGFEHILSEITRRIIDNTTEPHSMRHRLIHLGADPTAAAAIDASVRDALNRVTSLGSADDRVDGEQLSSLAERVQRLDIQLQDMADRAPADSQLADAIKKGAGTEAGARAVTVGIQAVVQNWDRIRLGLAVAWKSIAAIFLNDRA